MEDFSNFHVHLQEENIEFYELLWRRVENWQAEESGERLYFRDLLDFYWKYSACWSAMFLVVYFRDPNVTIVLKGKDQSCTYSR